MNNPTSLAELLLGLDGFQILEVIENPDELVIHIETKITVVGCPTCGVRAQAKDRMQVDIRDLPCFGRPARLVWLSALLNFNLIQLLKHQIKSASFLSR